MARENFNLSKQVDIKNPVTNIDYRYGAYPDIASLLIGIPKALRKEGREALVVDPITKEQTVYWFKNGLEDSNLVRKYSKHFGIVTTSSQLPSNPIQGDRINVTVAFDKFKKGAYYHDGISTWVLESTYAENGKDGKDGEDGKDFTYADFTPQQLEALRGPKGDDGTSVRILGEKANQSELPLDGELGDGYLIVGDLWVWNGTEYINVGTIKGPKGDKGIQGDRGERGEKGLPFLYGDFTPAQLAALKGEKGDPGQDGKDGEDGQDGPTYIAGTNVEIDDSNPLAPIINVTATSGGIILEYNNDIKG